jgi:RNA polymerase sigma-70 factor (ECF subfamily)
MNRDHSPPEHLTAVQQLFIEHQPGIRAYILSIVRDFSLAQDVLQETFLKITRKAANFQLGTNFMAWACTIARFESLTSLRKANKPGLESATLELLAATEETEPPEIRTDWLAACLKKLTPTVQRLLHLRYQDALKPAEIARLVNWTPNSVCVATSRARTELRKCIERLQTATQEP